MEFKDHYATLGVERGASADELKRAYRRLARRYHPDVSTAPDAEERFKAIGEAYDVLRDPEKRADYDAFGAGVGAGQGVPPGWQGFDPGPGGFASGDLGDLFSDLFRRQPGGQPGGARRTDRGARHGHLRIRGEDVHARVTIPLEDAFEGCRRSLSLQAPEMDPLGQVATRARTLSVTIPRGVTAGQRIRLAGQGGPGIGGAPAGDLFLEINLEPHPLFEVDGRDVTLRLPVAPWEAALGRTVPVPTLGGTVNLDVPAGSQGGRRLRLRGRGLPGEPAGDQYVVLEIVVPRARDAKARALYEQMERELAFDPRAGLGARRA